jgi:hypothetical protein
MYIEGTGFYTFKECHKTESLQNHTATAHKERERLGDRRNVGEISFNSGDGTGQMAQPLMFIMMDYEYRMKSSVKWQAVVDRFTNFLLPYKLSAQRTFCTLNSFDLFDLLVG